jgi:excinuclease ABC subunit C
LGARPSERRSAEDFLNAFDVSSVPTAPGCYIMRDEQEQPIYVGKAKNLRARLRQYVNDQDSRYSVQFLMRRVADVEFLVTSNEKEALLLENSLIKQYKPRYNVRLKDDKTYISLRVSLREDFPRVTVVRRYKKDGAKYFGPYSSAQAVRETLRFIHRLFPLRRCSDAVMNNRARPCLYHQMKQCLAPCVGLVSGEAYHEVVNQVTMVLDGRNAELEKTLLQQIREHADRLEFEQAAALRDRLRDLQRTVEPQRTVAVPGKEDRDVFGVYTHGRLCELQVLFFRGGKMLGGRSFSFVQREMPIDEVLSSFLLQYYGSAPAIPPEVLVPMELEEREALADLLTEHRGAKVTVHCPQRGDMRALVEMAARNAKSSFEEKQLAAKANADLLEQVRVALKLEKTPRRIECYDISTIQGEKSVGAMVTFEGGMPNKSRYRRFAIRRVEGQDDFGMLREVLLRRFKKAVEENDLPDLVVIDGGRGQLNVALAVFEDLGIDDLPAIGMAKARSQAGERSPERFVLPGRVNPLILSQQSPVVHLMVRLRDEAHRFAITYHRAQRKRATLRTPLTEIPGIGPARARTLLNTLGSLATIRASSVEEIAGLPGFNDSLAQRVKDYISVSPAEQS